MQRLGPALSLLIALSMACGLTVPQTSAIAALDIGDRGPVLNAGGVSLRVTNVGVIGNAFYDRGLSFDPSFEFPRGSGQELLHHAELWVGGRTVSGERRVSGGPLMEWRPSLETADVVRLGWAGHPGSQRGIDDDGDGSVDEEAFNGQDDDGDGALDEDMGFPSQQVAIADFRDDRPESINHNYSTGESHVPLGLAVHQEAYAWATPGHDRFVGLQFRVTNVSGRPLRDVYIGIYCDFDSRLRDDGIGHLNDRVIWRSYARSQFRGTSRIGNFSKQCFATVSGTIPTLEDGSNSGLPAVALVPLTHTTDPLALLEEYAAFPGLHEARIQARAPGRDNTFQSTVFSKDVPAGQGGPPLLDRDRYEALSGTFPSIRTSDRPGDYSILLACGPFTLLDPGQEIECAVALVAAPSGDSLRAAIEDAALLHYGTELNTEPDSALGKFQVGETGVNGHELCYEPPAGIVFNYDPDCLLKFIRDPAYVPPPPRPPPVLPDILPREATYQRGQCTWSDFDCDACTGLHGEEVIRRWRDPGLVPPAPAYRSSPGDLGATVSWDNMPEIVLGSGALTLPTQFAFAGYRVYRLSDWRDRHSLLPPPERWSLLGSFGGDTMSGGVPLAAVCDSSIQPDTMIAGLPHYPVGRYRVVDRDVLNGFDYLYVVTSVAERHTVVNDRSRIERIESPLVASIDSVIVPNTAARERPGGAWVVPNPFRAHAPWDRPPVPGDPFGRHIDFCGLPKARSTIRIYTVAGDFVAQLEHDGRDGDGQAPWDLISRNGQDVESGIYLFTVDSSIGRQVGKFVIIR